MILELSDLAFLAVVSATEIPTVPGFNSFTFGGPYYIGGWSVGLAGQNPFGVAVRGIGADEPIHNTSGSIM